MNQRRLILGLKRGDHDSYETLFDLYYAKFVNFADAILNDLTPPMDVYRAVETAAPAILAAESARQGGILLQVPDFRKK